MFASLAHDCRAGLSQQERHTCNVSLSRRHTPLGSCGKRSAYAIAVASARPCRAVQQECVLLVYCKAAKTASRIKRRAPNDARTTHAVRPPPALTASVASSSKMADSGSTALSPTHSTRLHTPISLEQTHTTRRPDKSRTRLSSDGVWFSGSTRLPDDFRQSTDARDAFVTQSLELRPPQT